MPRIDFHSHLVPKPYHQLLPEPVQAVLPALAVEDLAGMMERCAIESAVVSISAPGAFFGDQGKANETARVANEALAEAKRSGTVRLAVLALLPLPDVDAALEEVHYALDTLGFDGVNLLSNVAATYLGDRSWDPLYDELSRREAYVFLHPGLPPYGPPLGHPVWLYEVPFETTRAVTNLVYSGTLDRYPGITWQLAHLGGDVPFLGERLASLLEREPEQAGSAERRLVEYLPDFYYDTGLSNYGPAIEATTRAASLTKVVFGSDWPYCAIPDAGEPFPGLAAIDPDERRAIEDENGVELVPQLVAALR
jgi:6-methylsalicylate decarboxylase